MGNTCYMNAILQCLLNIDIFSNELMENYVIFKENQRRTSENGERENLFNMKDIDASFKRSLYRYL